MRPPASLTPTAPLQAQELPHEHGRPTRAEVSSRGHWVWQAVRAKSAARDGSLLRAQALRRPWGRRCPPLGSHVDLGSHCIHEGQARGLSSDMGGVVGTGITLKKWAVMSWVRAPSWEKFLCKIVEASEEGRRKTRVGGHMLSLIPPTPGCFHRLFSELEGGTASRMNLNRNLTSFLLLPSYPISSAQMTRNSDQPPYMVHFYKASCRGTVPPVPDCAQARAGTLRSLKSQVWALSGFCAQR